MANVQSFKNEFNMISHVICLHVQSFEIFNIKVTLCMFDYKCSKIHGFVNQLHIKFEGVAN